MLSAILVQLFGREVIDRLSLGGFETAEAIASAGPERLAEESGIPVALARRIIAVAAEEAGSPGAPPPGAPPHAGPAESPGHERHVRRPFRRPHHATLTASDPPSDGDGPEHEKPGDDAPEAPIDRDPFVDDVGLVSWMGFAARHGGAPAAPLAVSDAILDPASPAVPLEGRAETGETTASSPRAAAPAAAPPRAATPASPGRIEGSFWSFGAAPVGEAGAPRAETGDGPPATHDRDRSGAPRPGPAGTPPSRAGERPASAEAPRRRSRDGH